ncbi:MAG: MFS transporter [Clostridia bacterium]|nr:MFS transporter [Clostridia bacterium]
MINQPIQALDKKWKEFLFAFSGFGPNLLMILFGAYFQNAVNPIALDANNSIFAIAPSVIFIYPALFPILFAIGRVFDGIIDIPFAHITDTLSTKWGRRRPTIAVCMIPMIVAFALMWMPICPGNNETGQIVNTFWIFGWSIVFFATYTMCMISFYGSLSTTCVDEPQRLRVSSYKSFFDTITYCLVYALVPVILQATGLQINTFVFCLLPVMLTISIPLFMIKEGEKYGYPEKQGGEEKPVKLGESIVLTVKNKVFMRWLAVNCCTYFGLQMFLSSMNALIEGGMGMNGIEMALLNTCAFAPVPVMLFLFNKVKAKKGVRFTYQTCLLAFAVAMLSFFFGSTLVTGGNKIVQYIIGCTGGVVGSWGIGAFFMMPLLATAQIASMEETLTKKNHSAMYFAGNAVVTSVIGAISGSLIYEYIKMFFFAPGVGIVWAETAEQAQLLLSTTTVYNLGNTLVPFIVTITCVLGFFLAFRMPKDYAPRILAREMKKDNPELDITEIETNPKYEKKEEKGEITFINIGLTILSGFIFGFIWMAYLIKSVKEISGKKFNSFVMWLLSCLVPWLSIYTILKMTEMLRDGAAERGIDVLKQPWFSIVRVVLIVLAVIFPILPINVVAMALLQRHVNAIYAEDDKKEKEATVSEETAVTEG